MQTSVCRSSSLSDRGFTLIEILVVMVIVTVITGIAVATMPMLVTEREFDREAHRLKAVLELASERAIVQAEEIGFTPEGDGYYFSRYDPLSQRWDKLAESPWQPRQLAEGISLELEIEGFDYEQPRNMPPILLLSSGELTPSNIILADAGNERMLTTDGLSGFQWQDELDDVSGDDQ